MRSENVETYVTITSTTPVWKRNNITSRGNREPHKTAYALRPVLFRSVTRSRYGYLLPWTFCDIFHFWQQTLYWILGYFSQSTETIVFSVRTILSSTLIDAVGLIWVCKKWITEDLAVEVDLERDCLGGAQTAVLANTDVFNFSPIELMTSQIQVKMMKCFLGVILHFKKSEPDPTIFLDLDLERKPGLGPNPVQVLRCKQNYITHLPHSCAMEQSNGSGHYQKRVQYIQDE